MANRARMADSVIGAAGAPLIGTTITVFNFGTTTPTGDSLYAGPTGATAFSGIVNASGRWEIWTDAVKRYTVRLHAAGYADQDLTYETTLDPAEIVRTTGTQTRDAGLTLTSPVLNTPTINGGVFAGIGLTNPVATGGSWTNGTFTTPAFSGTVTMPDVFTALGVPTGGKGGISVANDGGILMGRQVALGAVAGDLLAANIESPADTAGHALFELAMMNRSNSDSALITASAFEGNTNSWSPSSAPTAAASNWMTGEWRMLCGLYPTKIAAGHGGTRTVGGFGLSTQTANPLADGTRADLEVGVVIDCDGRATFPNAPVDGVRGGTALVTKGFTGWMFHILGLKDAGSGVPTDPLYAIDQYGRIGAHAIPAAMLHARRNSAIAATTDPVGILQGDHTNAIATGLLIRGQTDTAKRLAAGFNTTSNYGSIDSQTTGAAAAPLLLNPTGGGVILRDITDVNGATGSRLFVKQLADTIGNGATVAKTGTGNVQVAHLWAETGKINLSSWLPGTGFATMSITTAGAYQMNGTQLLAATRQTGPAAIAQTAGGTYTANEQGMLASLKAEFNVLRAALNTAGHGLTT